MFDICPKFKSRNRLICTHYSYNKINNWPSTYHHILKAIHCRGIRYHLNVISLHGFPRTDPMKDNSKLKGNKSFLECCIMYLTKCSLV